MIPCLCLIEQLFQVNWLIDRDFTISYMIVDDIQGDYPELLRDRWWDEIFPTELPYTVAAQKFKDEKGCVVCWLN